MSNVKCCDFHDGKMTESEISHKVIINGVEFDCCDACLNGTVILAEHRRTRTRKPAKAKPGRPKGSRTRKEAETFPGELTIQKVTTE
jgi:hypothetical protein